MNVSQPVQLIPLPLSSLDYDGGCYLSGHACLGVTDTSVLYFDIMPFVNLVRQA